VDPEVGLDEEHIAAIEDWARAGRTTPPT
jgi:hypothetical protein